MSGLGYISIESHIDTTRAVLEAVDYVLGLMEPKREPDGTVAPASPEAATAARTLVKARTKLSDDIRRVEINMERTRNRAAAGERVSPVTSSEMGWVMYPIDQLILVGQACLGRARALEAMEDEHEHVDVLYAYVDQLRQARDKRAALLASHPAARRG